VQVTGGGDLDQVVAAVDDRPRRHRGHRGTEGRGGAGGEDPPVQRPPPHGVVVGREVAGGIVGRSGAEALGVGAQDPLAVPARSTVDDQYEVTGGQLQTRGVPGGGRRVRDRLDPGQLHEVVATSDRAQTVGEPAGQAAELVHHVPRRVVGGHLAVEVRKPAGQLLGHRALEGDREHRDAAADVGADQVRVQHGRGHRGADRGALAGVQVGHAGDVPHTVERGDLAALVDGVGLDPARGRGEDPHAGCAGARGGGRQDVLPRTGTAVVVQGQRLDQNVMSALSRAHGRPGNLLSGR
jgi:hypothetical protein